MPKLLCCVLIPVFLLAPGLVGSSVAAWPLDSDWVPISGVNTVPIEDPLNGYGPRDIVGSGSDPAGYFYSDTDFLYFRIRLDESPLISTHWAAFGFYCLIEEDDDGVSYDYALQFYEDGLNSETRIARNSTQVPNWCIDGYEEVTHTYPAPPDQTGSARVAPAATTFGGDADWFLDVRFGWADWVSVTGNTDIAALVQIVLVTTAGGLLDPVDTADLECGDPWLAAPIPTRPTTWGKIKRLD